MKMQLYAIREKTTQLYKGSSWFFDVKSVKSAYLYKSLQGIQEARDRFRNKYKNDYEIVELTLEEIK